MADSPTAAHRGQPSQRGQHIKVDRAKSPPVRFITYEFGARIDTRCERVVLAEIQRARTLYNQIIAVMKDAWREIQAAARGALDEEGRRLVYEVDHLDQLFDRARAADDRQAMIEIAQRRRAARGELWPKIADARARSRDETRQHFIRVGCTKANETYRLRCIAVEAGLGFATATAVLNAALMAWERRIKFGRAPNFVVGAEKTSDTLTLQFTTKGGIPSHVMLAGQNRELRLQPPPHAGKRKYGTFQMRLGAGAVACFITGTWQYHRSIPKEASITRVRLIRRRIGHDHRYYLQFLVDLGEARPYRIPQSVSREPLAAVHFGWAPSEDGRRVAAIAVGMQPCDTELLHLPVAIEAGFRKVQQLESERGLSRDRLVAELKTIEPPAGLPKEILEELNAVRRLPAQRISYARLHRLSSNLTDQQPTALRAWQVKDRLLSQQAAHLTSKMRNRRRDLWRDFAINLNRRFGAIALEPLDLAGSAIKVDERSGEHTKMTKPARAGRVIAAPSYLEQAIRWAAQKTETPLYIVTGATTASCATCNAPVAPSETDPQLVSCTNCGTVHDRKTNAATQCWHQAHQRRKRESEI